MGSRWVLGLCISNKLPDYSDIAGPWAIPWTAQVACHGREEDLGKNAGGRKRTSKGDRGCSSEGVVESYTSYRCKGFRRTKP